MNTQADTLSSTTPFLSGEGRARVTIALLAAGIVANLLMLVFALLQYGMVSRHMSGVEITSEEVLTNELRMALANVLSIALQVATAIAFLMWLHRAYRNLHALGVPHQQIDYTPGWAVGYFFIPLLNLFYPYRVVKEVWRKSDPTINPAEGYSAFLPEAPMLLGVWWAFWIISLSGDDIVYRFIDSAEESSEAMSWFSMLLMATAILKIIAAALAIRVVREINQRQEERSRLVTFIPDLPPPPSVYTTPSAA